jgi:hypothetical protein
MEIVNGYPCRDCGEAELAKRNIDPAKGLLGTRLAEQERRAAERVEPPLEAQVLPPSPDPARGRLVDIAA